MPHITIKHLPVELDEQHHEALVSKVTEAVRSAFGVDESVISIALEPVAPEVWNEQVYIPEIASRRDLLSKAPDY